MADKQQNSEAQAFRLVSHRAVKPVPITIGGKERFLYFNFKAAGEVKALTGQSILDGSLLNSLDEEKLVALVYAGLVGRTDETKLEDIAGQLDLSNWEYYLGCVAQALGAQVEPETKSKNAKAPSAKRK